MILLSGNKIFCDAGSKAALHSFVLASGLALKRKGPVSGFSISCHL